MKSKMHEAFLAQQKYTDEEAIAIINAREQTKQDYCKAALKQLGLEKEPEELKPQQMEITNASPPSEMKGEIGIDWGGLMDNLGI